MMCKKRVKKNKKHLNTPALQVEPVLLVVPAGLKFAGGKSFRELPQNFCRVNCRVFRTDGRPSSGAGAARRLDCLDRWDSDEHHWNWHCRWQDSVRPRGIELIEVLHSVSGWHW